jgi:disease resistance protein RPM1
MAEALVFAVLQKIAEVVGEEVVKAGIANCFNEVSELREVRYNINLIQREFDVMQGFLRKVDVQASSDQCFARWLEQVRKVAYDVEDIIDEYAYLIGRKRSIKNITKRTIYNIKKGKTWHEMASQLKEVKGQIDHLTEMRERYQIIIPEGRGSNRPPNMSDHSHLVDENEIVGNLDEKNQLIQWLANTHQDRAIISIWGMGGLGKTTLVSAIYKTNEIKEMFECCAFISVSQNFQVEDLLRSTIKQILEKEGKKEGKYTTEFDRTDGTSLEETIRRKLQNKRYLIVLDDVWSRDAWLSLSRAFPKNNEGSRVVITTRMEDVACLADENWSIIMRALPKEEAWELFIKKTFGKLKEKTCPQELVGWAEKIVDRCQGLPLAIVAIGSLLSFKGMKEIEWRLFYNQLSWELSNNAELSWVANVLNLSYDNLPTHLKNCFLYCSLFPEDFLIHRTAIIRLLIAEGFIEDRGPQITMEEVAESYLVELAHRSLLQVVERNVSGRAKKFKMHDLVRDICIAKAKTESFGIGCDNQLSSLDGKARRIFIHNIDGDGLQSIVDLPKLRSLLLFTTELSVCGMESALLNLRLLRVLSLSKCNIESFPDVISELFNLRYLDLSYTKVKVIPKSLGKMRLLETLDLTDTRVQKLPREITNLSKLRYLFVQCYHDYECQQYDFITGASLPSKICGLKDLRTLGSIEADDELFLKLGSLVNLKCLSLTRVKASHVGDLWLSITKIPFLSTLEITACDKDEVLNLQTLDPLPSLKKLHLQGKLEGVIPLIFGSLSNLTDLRLGWLGLHEDPLSSFSHMSNLVKLYLYRAYEGHSLTFRLGWFPKLQFLYLVDLFELDSIDFEDGTMRSLHCLQLIGLSKLTHVPEGMRYLRILKKLILTDMPEKFFRNLEGDDRNIVQHIPSILMYCKILISFTCLIFLVLEFVNLY